MTADATEQHASGALSPAANKLHVPKGGYILGSGFTTLDLLYVVPSTQQRMQEVSVFSMQGGGTGANTVAAAAALGAKTRLMARISDDDFGAFILGELRTLGVDTKAVSVEPGKVSPVAIVNIDEYSRKRTIRYTMGNLEPLDLMDVEDGFFQDASMLCIDGYYPEFQIQLAKKAKSHGLTVMLNASHMPKLEGLLALADIVVGSERFAAEVAPLP